MCFTKLLLFGIDWCILPRDCASFLLSAMFDTNSYLTTHRWGASLKAALHSRCAMSDTKSLHKPLIHTSSPPIIILGTYLHTHTYSFRRLELGGNGVLNLHPPRGRVVTTSIHRPLAKGSGMLRPGVRRRIALLMSSRSITLAAALFAFFCLHHNTNIMAIVQAFRPAALLVRRGNTFRTANAATTRLQFSSSSSSSGGLGLDIKPPLPAAGGGRRGELRRRRAKPDSNSLAKLASQLPGYQEGTFNILHSTTANDTENMVTDSSTAAINAGGGREEGEYYYQKLFPNIGKNVLELPPRMRYVVNKYIYMCCGVYLVHTSLLLPSPKNTLYIDSYILTSISLFFFSISLFFLHIF